MYIYAFGTVFHSKRFLQTRDLGVASTFLFFLYCLLRWITCNIINTISTFFSKYHQYIAAVLSIFSSLFFSFPLTTCRYVGSLEQRAWNGCIALRMRERVNCWFTKRQGRIDHNWKWISHWKRDNSECCMKAMQELYCCLVLMPKTSALLHLLMTISG